MVSGVVYSVVVVERIRKVWTIKLSVTTRVATFDTFFWSSVKSDLSRYIMKA